MKPKSILRKNRFLSLLFGGFLGVVFPVYASFFVTFKSTPMFVLFSAGCVAAGFSVGIVSWLINTKTVKKMAVRLSAALDGVARGEKDALRSVNVESDDELGLLIEKFRTGLEYYEKAARVLGDERGEVSALMLEAHGAIEGVLAAITEFTAALTGADQSAADLDTRNREIQRGFETLNKAALLSASHVIELYSSVNEFAQAVTVQGERMRGVSEALASIEVTVGMARGESGASNLRWVSKSIADRVEQTIETTLGAFSGIASNLESIGALAERTNVLSINAAIESARLGKEGMGFRIISGNIKLLADEVNALTRKIKSVMDDGDREIRDATGELSRAAGSLGSLLDALQTTVESMKKLDRETAEEASRIGGFTPQIAALLQDIRENMQNLKGDVASTRGAFDAVMASSTRIHADIATLSDRALAIERKEKIVNASLDGLLGFINGFNEKRRTSNETHR